jgi:hypothetical protein
MKKDLTISKYQYLPLISHLDKIKLPNYPLTHYTNYDESNIPVILIAHTLYN